MKKFSANQRKRQAQKAEKFAPRDTYTCDSRPNRAARRRNNRNNRSRNYTCDAAINTRGAVIQIVRPADIVLRYLHEDPEQRGIRFATEVILEQMEKRREPCAACDAVFMRRETPHGFLISYGNTGQYGVPLSNGSRVILGPLCAQCAGLSDAALTTKFARHVGCDPLLVVCTHDILNCFSHGCWQ